MSEENRVTISFGDVTVGWCSSCNRICDTGTIDAEGRFCCGTCGDHLIFNSEELIRELQQARQQRDTLKQQLAELRESHAGLVKALEGLGDVVGDTYCWCATDAWDCETAECENARAALEAAKAVQP